jgi:Flp pilus assembly protein TadD
VAAYNKHAMGQTRRSIKRRSAQSAGSQSRLAWVAAFIAVCLVAYSPALRAPFVYDDIPAIVQNESIRDLAPAAFTPPANSPLSGRPLVNVSFAINAALNRAMGIPPGMEGETTNYRVTNLVLHVGVGLLIFGIVGRTARRAWAGDSTLDSTMFAGAVTLIWLAHPLNSEAVIYLTQRTELMVSLFYAATVYAAIRASDATDARPRRRWRIAAVVACALGMLCKEVMFTAPFVVLLYDRAFRAGSWGELWSNSERRPFYAALFATTLIVLATTFGGARTQSVGFDLGVTWYEYLYTQAWAIARYLRMVFWPVGLTFDYGDIPVRDARGIPGAVLLSLLAIGTVIAWTRQRFLWLGFLGAWFFLLLAPSSSVVPIRTEMAAERRVYLASVAIVALAVLGMSVLLRRARFGVRATGGATAVLVVVLTACTFNRGRTYQSNEALYRDLVEKAPNNPRAHIGFGLTLAQEGPERLAEAERALRHAVALDSNSFVAWRSLGIVQLMRSDWRSAIPSLERALARRPGVLDVTVGLARAHVELGQADAAVPYVQQAGTADLDLLWSLGAILVERQQPARALPFLELAAAQGNPPPRGLGLLSFAYAQVGRRDESLTAARLATSLAENDARTFLFAGRAMKALGRATDARQYLTHAVTLEPTLVEAERELRSVARP